MGRKRRLLDEYQFPGFRPNATIKGVFGDPKARVIHLKRTQKKRYVDVATRCIGVITIRRYDGYGTYPVEIPGFIWKWRFGEYNAKGVEG